MQIERRNIATDGHGLTQIFLPLGTLRAQRFFRHGLTQVDTDFWTLISLENIATDGHGLTQIFYHRGGRGERRNF